MKANIEIIGANELLKAFCGKKFSNIEIGKNEQDCIVFLLKDSDIEQIYLNPNSNIFFTPHGFVMEGYGVIGYNVGKLSILIQSYETNAIL